MFLDYIRFGYNLFRLLLACDCRGPETQIPSVRLSKSGSGFQDLDRRTD